MANFDERTAALGGTEEQLFKLVSRHATPSQWAEWLRAPLEHAVAEGNQHLASTLLRAGADGGAGWKGCDGRSLLDAAVQGGNGKTVSALLEAGSLGDVNAVTGSDRRSPLHRAIAGGHTAVARVLMLAGAGVSLLDSDNRSALHYALRGGHRVLAGDVMIAGADVNAKDRCGETPLHIAAAAGDGHSVCTLLRRGGRVGVADNQGRCPLHAAVRAGHTVAAEALLKAGADPSARYGSSLKFSPLQLACSSREAAMTRALLKHGADVKGCDGFGFTALHWAAYRGKPSVIEAVVGAGADLEARSSQVWLPGHRDSHVGLTPLHIAAFFRRSHTPRMAVLLERGADVNAADGHGRTPLHIVAAAPATESSAADIDFLLRRGADETAKDNFGRTPEEVVTRSSSAGPIKSLLRRAPADRAWRRRGPLVLSRVHAEREEEESGVVAGKVLRQRAGCAGGDASAGRESCGGVLERVVGLEAEEVFRAIVGFV
ncbi:unnamed protein product [Ectocarpus fasciculatus]